MTGSEIHDVALKNLCTNSSVIKRTTPEERRKINLAIIDRVPPTYRAVYDKFALGERRISFTAFYNYARKIRLAAARYAVAELAAPSPRELGELLPRLLGANLVECLMYGDDDAPLQIGRLLRAYKTALDARPALAEAIPPDSRRLLRDLEGAPSEPGYKCVQRTRELAALREELEQVTRQKDALEAENVYLRAPFEAVGFDVKKYLERIPSGDGDVLISASEALVRAVSAAVAGDSDAPARRPRSTDAGKADAPHPGEQDVGMGVPDLEQARARG